MYSHLIPDLVEYNTMDSVLSLKDVFIKGKNTRRILVKNIWNPTWICNIECYGQKINHALFWISPQTVVFPFMSPGNTASSTEK